VRRGTEQRPLSFDRPQKFQQQRPLLGIVPMLAEISHHPNRPLDRNDLLKRESRLFNLVLQFVRVMEKR
jgi:hypothetical protein